MLVCVCIYIYTNAYISKYICPRKLYQNQVYCELKFKMQ